MLLRQKTDSSTKEGVKSEEVTSERHVLSSFGTIVDVSGDGNCGYCAIMDLLANQSIIEATMSVTAFRKVIYEFIGENGDNIITSLEYAVHFRNSPDYKSRVDTFLSRLKRRIYIPNKLFDSGTTRRHWMDPGYDIPIIAICYSVTVGFYDILRGTTFIASPTSNGIAEVTFASEIIPPPAQSVMIVYNGTNHFGYLKSHETDSDEVDNHDSSKDARNMHGAVDVKEESFELINLHPMNEEYYEPFIPDYTSCELFIRAIGYDIESSSLIGHRLLLRRSTVSQKEKSWVTKQLTLYQSVWTDCVEKSQNRTTGYRLNSKIKKISVKIKKEESKSQSTLNPATMYNESRKGRYVKMETVCKAIPKVKKKHKHQQKGR